MDNKQSKKRDILIMIIFCTVVIVPVYIASTLRQNKLAHYGCFSVGKTTEIRYVYKNGHMVYYAYSYKGVKYEGSVNIGYHKIKERDEFYLVKLLPSNPENNEMNLDVQINDGVVPSQYIPVCDSLK